VEDTRHSQKTTRRPQTFGELVERIDPNNHSGSPTVEIDVKVDDEMVTLAIKDAGWGIPDRILEQFHETGLAGIGLAGMRERVVDLGGELHLQSDKKGTLLMARIPLRAGAPRTAQENFVT
jgi:signal transduction histidine kinase